MRRLIQLLSLIFVLCITHSAFCYTVVLKNGKVKEGTLVLEDNDCFIIQDSTGIKMTFKKSMVDLVKTASKNVATDEKKSAEPAAKTETVTKPEADEKQKDDKSKMDEKSETTSKTEKPADSKLDPKSKKGRVLKEEDLEKLRGKYDFGSSSGDNDNQPVEEEQSSPSDDNPERSESDWKNDSNDLRERAEMAQKAFNALQNECQSLQGVTVQTHVLVDQDGAGLPVQETSQKVCEQAAQAQDVLNQANAEYQNFLSEAKHENVPPGWIRNPDGTDPQQ